MRDPYDGRGDSDTEVAAAFVAADGAARTSGVQLREVTSLDDVDAVARLFDGIWRPDPTNPAVTPEWLRALSKAGSYVIGAFDGPALVGACVGFFGPPADGVLHSHVAGVSAAARGRDVGFALKVHQRAWALRRGVSTVAWTFDPLVRRNAYFNLVKLAAVPHEYLVNFYGVMQDEINGGDDSDRLLVHWPLGDPRVAAACAGAGAAAAADAAAARAAGGAVVLAVGPDGGPLRGGSDGDASDRGASGGGTVLVAVPADIEALRRHDPGCARDWRVAVRESLGTLLADGARFLGFDKTGWYLLQRGTA